MSMTSNKGLFFESKNKRLSRIISITSPTAFNKSIRELKKGGLTTTEKRALVLARNRAGAIAKKKNLSTKERRQMMKIKRTALPPVTKHQKKKK